MNVIILRPTETVFECYKEYGMKKLSMSEDADDYLETKLFYDPYCDRVNNSVAAWITRFTEIRTTPRTNTYLYDYRTQYHAHGISLIETSQMHFFNRRTNERDALGILIEGPEYYKKKGRRHR